MTATARISVGEPGVDQIVDCLGRADYWRESFSGSVASSERECWRSEARPLPVPVAGRGRFEQMCAEGFVSCGGGVDRGQVAAVQRIVEQVEAAGWLPVYAFLFDEVWALVRSPVVRKLMTELLGAGFQQLPVFYIWRVEAGSGQYGYRPHRELGRRGFTEPDGTPLSLTVWVPLTDATPENGCMSVVPRSLEVTELGEDELLGIYGAGSLTQLKMMALLHRARSLPVRRGGLLCWNHEVLHWGGFSSSEAVEDRVSLAVEFQRGDRPGFQHPHATLAGPADGRARSWLLSADEALPSFAERVLLVASCVASFQLERVQAAPFVEASRRILSARSEPSLKSSAAGVRLGG